MEKQPSDKSQANETGLDKMMKAIKQLDSIDHYDQDSIFLELEHDYEVALPLEDGEVIMQKIAEQTDKEYQWVYDESTSIWRYLSDNKTKKTKDEKTGGTLQYGLVVHREFETPSNDSEVYYHIHPFSSDRYKTDIQTEKSEVFTFLGQLPSPEDVVFFSTSGYLKCRIVSEMGVTEAEIDQNKFYDLIDNPNAKRDESGRLVGLDLSYPYHSDIARQITKDGKEASLVRLLEKATDDCGGIIKYSFRKIPEVKPKKINDGLL